MTKLDEEKRGHTCRTPQISIPTTSTRRVTTSLIEAAPPSATMPSPPENSPPSQPTRQVFIGVFQLWAKPRLPPDSASVVDRIPNPPCNSGGEFVMPNGSVVGGHAADATGLEVRDGNLRRFRCLGGIGQRAIALPLMRSLLVVVDPYSADIHPGDSHSPRDHKPERSRSALSDHDFTSVRKLAA